MEKLQEDIKESNVQYKLYTIDQIVISSIFFTAFTGIYMLGINFYRLKDKLHLKSFIVVGGVYLFILSPIMIYFSSQIYNLITIVLVVIFFYQFQDKDIKQYLSKGGQRESYFKALRVGFFILAIVLLIIFIRLSYFYPSLY